MSKSYKRGCGLIQHRGYGGKFRKGTLEDIGIYNANKELVTYICNICDGEWIPIVHSGICFKCGVDDKRVKEIALSEAQQVITDKIKSIRQKSFINRFDIEEIQKLEFELKKQNE